MIFNRGGKTLNKNNNFHFGNDEIEVVSSYIYLGLLLNPSGKLGAAMKNLYGKAKRALYKLKRQLPFPLTHNVGISLKLFDSIIRPVLLYCCELWFDRCKPDVSISDKFHNAFCKQVLGLGHKASNLASKAELGRFSLNLFASKQALKYQQHLLALVIIVISKKHIIF